jgi:endonuclease/exonuclease/phosphatase family metal-dependent hydrolase
VQRILSLATLGVLGGLAWMFLSGGGLNQLAQPGGAAAPAQQAGGWNGGSLPSWPSANAPAQSPPVQPVGAGTAAPPAGVGPTITIASFNIKDFGEKKMGTQAVIQTLAEIVRQFDVVAIQEISTQNDYFLANFLKVINQPIGANPARNYDGIIGPRLGNSTQTEQYAFLFNADRILCSQSSKYTVGDPDNLLHREPYVATFATRVNPDEAFTFTLINVHTDPDEIKTELPALAEVYRVVRRAGGDEDDVIMLGDFNADDAHLGRLGQIPGITPLIRGVFTNTRQNKLFDNLLIHQASTTEYIGESSVFDVTRKFNLALAQAEQVSDHFPVYAKFSAYERDYAGRIASRRGTAR